MPGFLENDYLPALRTNPNTTNKGEIVNQTLVNRSVLKALTRNELLEKWEQYHELGKTESGDWCSNIATIYLNEYHTRPL